MNLKKIEIFGFKSFADKLEIKFDSGITGIVGPNGCGKSNVADAIRWVLGEQSPKSLRGSSMQDVIFNGTEKRKSLSYCEVSLIFDNSDHKIPLEYNEIVISRKLYRSGESAYMLNRSECRLKDITSMLHDIGIGKEGYSIIGQGKIGEILSAKPEVRRAVFEEAAGITKYKKSKEECERKLLRTLDNLARAQDIIQEIERQLEPMTRQAENARNYLQLKEKLKFCEINNYISQYETCNQQKEVIQTRLDAITQEYDQKNLQHEQILNDYQSIKEQVDNLDQHISALKDELLELTVGREKQEGEIRLLHEKLQNLKNQGVKLEQDTLKYTDELTGVERQLDRMAGIISDREAELGVQQKKLSATNDSYQDVVSKISAGEGVFENTQEQVMDAMARLTDIKSNMSRLLAEKSSLTDNTKDISKRVSLINNKITDDEVKAILLKNEVDKTTEEREKLSLKHTELISKYNEGQSRLFEQSKRLEQLVVKNNTTAERFRILSDMRSDGGGFSHAVKKLIAACKINHFVNDKIEGVVAKLIEVPEMYEAAIETALGGALQNVVTRTEEDSKYLIEYLKQNNYGRATFLPITMFRPRSIDPIYQSKLKRSGVYGVAVDLIKYNKKYDSVMRGLLGSTVVCENLDIAIKLSKDTDSAFKIVTLEGDIVNPAGSLTGGSRKSELANVLAHEREYNRLGKEIEDLRKELMYAESEKIQLTKNQETLQNDIKALVEKIHAIDISIATNKEKHDKFVFGIEEQKRELFVLEEETARLERRIQEIDKDIKSVDELEAITSSKKESASSSIKQHNLEYDEYKKERDSLQQQITAYKVEIARIEGQLNAAKTEATRLKSEREELKTLIADNNAQMLESAQILKSAEERFKFAESQNTPENETRILEIRAFLENMAKEKLALQCKQTEYDIELKAIMKIVQDLSDNKHKEQMALSRIDYDLEDSRDKILAEYELDYEGCLPYRSEEEYDLKEGIAEATRLSKAINRLGNVNVNAIEDCKVLGARHAEFVTQHDDLIKSKNACDEILAEMVKTMTSQFVKFFGQIKTNFAQTFKEIFGGGNADLVLEEDGGVLEAGIKIIAEPPGKKLSNNMLLSGGEQALTAIAILFAILKIKPMPFCVLDEIEAALDDANANRFARYLNRFSHETQFIVITHRKPTMELADGLYGVTMEEKGVSKMVSVKLAEAIKVASENN